MHVRHTRRRRQSPNLSLEPNPHYCGLSRPLKNGDWLRAERIMLEKKHCCEVPVPFFNTLLNNDENPRRTVRATSDICRPDYVILPQGVRMELKNTRVHAAEVD